jgi:hypothetical protein
MATLRENLHRMLAQARRLQAEQLLRRSEELRLQAEDVEAEMLEVVVEAEVEEQAELQ